MTMSINPGPSQSLWDEACNRLPEDLKVAIQDIEVQRVGVLEEISKHVAKRLDAHHDQSLKFKKPGGGEVVVRDVLEGYIKWLDCFKAVGDSAVQYDPGHAALPWAAIRFVLQSAVNTIEVFNTLIANLEKISCMIRRHATSEDLYKRNTTPTGKELRESLKKLYTGILIYLAEAIRYLGSPRYKQVAKCAFKLPTDSDINRIEELDADVGKLLVSINGHKLEVVGTQIQGMENAVKRLEPTIELTLRQSVRKDENREWRDYLEWLSPINFEDQHQEVSRGRLEHSAEWILQNEEVAGWRDSDSSSMMLIYGVAGSGKSVLASKIIDSLEQRANIGVDSKVGYFYCRRSIAEPDRQCPDKILASILRQLAIGTVTNSSIHQQKLWGEFLKRQEKTGRDGFPPKSLNSEDSTRLISDIAELKTVFIILDAFDEVEERQRPELAEAVKSLISDSRKVVKVLITSRDDPQVMKLLSQATKLRIRPEHNKADIKMFIRHRIEQLKNEGLGVFADNPSAVFQDEVYNYLSQRSGEMFLLAKLQLDKLSSVETELGAEDVLRSLPLGISDAYEEAMKRIETSELHPRTIAIKTFQWLLHAKEPLSISALILAVVANSPEFAHREDMNGGKLVRFCRNLIVVDTKNDMPDRVRFAHPTIQEFLHLRTELSKAKSNETIARRCLDVCFGDILDDSDPAQTHSKDFHKYATLYWPLHYREATSGSLVRQLQDLAFNGSQKPSFVFEDWMDEARELSKSLFRDNPLRRDYLGVKSSTSSPFFMGCIFNFGDLLRSMDLENFDWNMRNEVSQTGLYIAASRGYSDTVDFLIEKGANINEKCGDFGSPLNAACFHGHSDIVQKLLACGAHPKQSTKSLANAADAMEAAARGGHDAIAQLLIQAELPNLSEEGVGAAIERAKSNGFFAVVDTLLKEERLAASAEIPDAIKHGHLGKLRKLLKRFPEPAKELPTDSVAIAARNGKLQLLEFLLDEQKLSVEACGSCGTPLFVASMNGHEQIVNALLRRGANARNGEALGAASMRGHLPIVRTLISTLKKRKQMERFILERAVIDATDKGHLKVLIHLADEGADIDRPGLAAEIEKVARTSGHEGIRRFMEERRKKIHGVDNSDPEAFPRDPTGGN